MCVHTGVWDLDLDLVIGSKSRSLSGTGVGGSLRDQGWVGRGWVGQVTEL